MRPIKFRAWDETRKTMVPDFDSWIDFDGQYWTIPDRVYDTPNTEIKRVNGFILEQFTGLTDKNGKEIYEGDIVLSSIWPDRKFIIVWEQKVSGFCYEPIDHDGFWEDLSDTDIIEVIGNIHQHSELLAPPTHADMTCVKCGKKAIGRMTPDMDLEGLGFCKAHKLDVVMAYISLKDKATFASLTKGWAMHGVPKRGAKVPRVNLKARRI
jgi:uncharacterized phage protein (TIGR01671 family)